MTQAYNSSSRLPHLTGEHEDFAALADVFCMHDGVRVPMHSLVLARESRVLAQLFSSLEESGKGERQLGEAKIFSGEKLQTVLLTLYLLYNSNPEVLKRTMQWGFKPSKEKNEKFWLPSTEKAPEVWQKTIRLAHKLDARRLLAGLEDQILKSSGNVLGGFHKQLLWIPFVCSEQPLSSFRSAILLSLSKSFVLRLMRGIGSLEKARDFVTMPAWEDLDKQTILMFVEALFFWMLREPIVLGDGREVLPFESWNAPGDLIKKHLRMLLGSHDADPSIGEEGHDGRGVNPHLDELVRLQQMQIEEDWEGEFDEYGSGPEVY